MEMYGQKSKSIPQKVTMILIEVLLLWFSYWILFQGGGAVLLGWTDIELPSTYTTRNMVVFIFSIVVFVRMGFMMLFLLKRKIPWQESVSVPFAFALYYVGFALLVLPTDQPLDLIDYFGIVLFAVGSFLNTYAEIQRHLWKKKPENKGKIYTEGLFKYSMHINYFGDLLWVSAYAIITRNYYAILVPVFLFCLFVFFNIPELDRYLAKKYGKAFDEYSRKTKKFIPFVY